jgi:hypothetical protein
MALGMKDKSWRGAAVLGGEQGGRYTTGGATDIINEVTMMSSEVIMM